MSHPGMSDPGMTDPGARLAANLERLTRLHPLVIDLSLDRLLRLLDTLGAPHRCLPPVVHVAGTNGKGSFIAYMAAALAAAGRRVHVYTSPHLVRFNERIVLDGAEVGDTRLIEALERVEAANRGGEITFFEITTAAAFLLFAEVPADYLLLETGLGGRLDATNVVDRPRLTVLTPVSLDHQGFLGDTLDAIAGEKAGILKPGVPAIVGPQPRAAQRVILDRASAIGAPARLWERDWRLEPDGTYAGPRWRFALPEPALAGNHQRRNAATAVAALEALDDPTVTADAAAQGVVRARWPARLQNLSTAVPLPPGWTLWLDGGHNPSAGRALADWAAARGRPLHLACAMLKVKDARGYLVPLARLATSFQALPMPEGHDALAPDDLAGIATNVGFARTSQTADWRAAVTKAASGAEVPGDIVICGSLYLAGRVLSELEEAPMPA